METILNILILIVIIPLVRSAVSKAIHPLGDDKKNKGDGLFGEKQDTSQEWFANVTDRVSDYFSGHADGDNVVFPAPPIVEEAIPAEKYAAMGPGALASQSCLDRPVGHLHDEGEQHSEHDKHMRTYLEEEKQHHQADVDARALRDLNIAGLRRAIVVSEILDKPKSLRMRNMRR